MMRAKHAQDHQNISCEEMRVPKYARKTSPTFPKDSIQNLSFYNPLELTATTIQSWRILLKKLALFSI